MKKELVSIVVVSYNSSRTIIQTLESFRRQTYNTLELIISDDCSKDDTVAICREWLRNNEGRFERSLIIEATHNTGVCGNLNRGINASTGTWIKALAADDELCDDAIEEYMKFCANNDSCRICVSDAYFINDRGEKVANESDNSIWRTFLERMGRNLLEQQKRVQRDKLCPGPPIFFSREAWNAFGGYKEKYKFADEWELQYSVVMNGFMIYPILKKLIYYRVSESSLCHSLTDNRSNISQLAFARDIVIPKLCKEWKFLEAWDVYLRRQVPYLIVKNSNRNYKYMLLLSPKYVWSRLITKKSK